MVQIRLGVGGFGGRSFDWLSKPWIRVRILLLSPKSGDFFGVPWRLYYLVITLSSGNVVGKCWEDEFPKFHRLG